MSLNAQTLSERAAAVIQDRRLAMHWVNRPNPLLDGKAPAEATASRQGRRMIERQLAWFAGQPPVDTASSGHQPDQLNDVVDDPMIQMMLERAGSGPAELLSLYRQAHSRRRAA